MVHQQAFKFEFLILLFVIFALYSCATLTVIPESSQNKIIDNVPFYPQDAYQCGPASLASVLNYLGVNESPDDVAHEIFSKSARGTLTVDMVLYAERKGMHVKQYSGNFDDIRQNVESCNPLIVLVDYGIYFYQKTHFMVVIGYNEKGVIVNSGRDKEHFVSYDDFSKIWKRTNFWTLLIKKVKSQTKIY
jgi:predicted double-glycine peptidase